MARKHSNARLKPRVYEEYVFKEPEPKPKIKLILPEPEPEPPTKPREQPISHGGGYKHTWMTRKGAG